MTTIINSKLGENRGKPRIWIEGAKLAREGYTPGDRYNLEIQSGRLILQAAEDGQYTVSKRTRNGRLLPIIDISKTELAELFDGVETLRVAISANRRLGGGDFALADALIDLSTGRLRLDRAGRDAGWPIAEGYEGGIEVCIPQVAQEGMVLPLGAAMEDAHNATLDEAVMCLRSDLVAKLIRERGHEVLIDLGSPAGQKLKGLLAPSFDAVKSVA